MCCEIVVLNHLAGRVARRHHVDVGGHEVEGVIGSHLGVLLAGEVQECRGGYSVGLAWVPHDLLDLLFFLNCHHWLGSAKTDADCDLCFFLDYCLKFDDLVNEFIDVLFLELFDSDFGDIVFGFSGLAY